MDSRNDIVHNVLMRICHNASNMPECASKLARGDPLLPTFSLELNMPIEHTRKVRAKLKPYASKPGPKAPRKALHLRHLPSPPKADNVRISQSVIG